MIQQEAVNRGTNTVCCFRSAGDFFILFIIYVIKLIHLGCSVPFLGACNGLKMLNLKWNKNDEATWEP